MSIIIKNIANAFDSIPNNVDDDQSAPTPSSSIAASSSQVIDDDLSNTPSSSNGIAGHSLQRASPAIERIKIDRSKKKRVGTQIMT